ncbi:hypothetical protein LR48_Vigan02g090300 [Vigna angularis]|uniref:Uncharacterized protein n=1 Tax=Phaseolus angularis TaxID=3914 RepID=A0A0L9TVY4_PHAAN|nr:hypothetical protein LR48_Vigan02g090300 [Vigna angularis]
MDQSQFGQAVGQFERLPQQQLQQQLSLSERMAKMDDAFQKFMQESISTHKSTEVAFKSMKMQIGHLIESLKDFGVDTEVNPREECQAIIIGSDKTLDEKKIERKEKEELSEKDKDVEKEREVVERKKRKKICVKMKKVSGKREGKKKVREKKKRTRGKTKESYEKPLPHLKKYPRKEKEFERFMEIFKKLEIKVPMIETLKQVPGDAEGSCFVLSDDRKSVRKLFVVNLVKEVKKERDGIRKDIRSRNYRSAAVYR